MPSSIPEVETYASSESFMSYYCRFAQVVFSLPHMEGVDLDFDLGIEYDDSGPSDKAHYRFVLYADGMLWCNLMMKKDLQSEYLRWYLPLKDFNFVVHDKNDVYVVGKSDAHTLIEPELEQKKGRAPDLKSALHRRQHKYLFFFFLFVYPFLLYFAVVLFTIFTIN